MQNAKDYRRLLAALAALMMVMAALGTAQDADAAPQSRSGSTTATTDQQFVAGQRMVARPGTPQKQVLVQQGYGQSSTAINFGSGDVSAAAYQRFFDRQVYPRR
jgi:hypothetical protein